jgi:hypothetical protein
VQISALCMGPKGKIGNYFIDSAIKVPPLIILCPVFPSYLGPSAFPSAFPDVTPLPSRILSVPPAPDFYIGHDSQLGHSPNWSLASAKIPKSTGLASGLTFFACSVASLCSKNHSEHTPKSTQTNLYLPLKPKCQSPRPSSASFRFRT